MGFREVKRSRADVLFSQYIREKRKHTCEKCGKRGVINGVRICQIEASHYMGRRKRTVRFDEENVRVLCNTCHERMGGYHRDENGEYDLWMKEILGERAYRNLVIRGNASNGTVDPKLELLYVKQLIKNNVTNNRSENVE